ncbi:MAG TPA: terminase family protein [Elusimicrobiales bacterium]|nr:terminase family protein [Elusimicrobiales bacterium]
MPSKAPKFLSYQARWLKDTSRIKIWEKSRRIGATYVQSFEDVSDCIATPGLKVWFSSADETAAREYIDYCESWAKLHQRAAKALGEQLIDEKNGVKAYVIEFRNGARIHALSSNPKGFRSKGGKVILDEFAWHDDANTLWAAARPSIMWGHPLRILSTHNGTSSKFYRFIEDIKAGRLKWNLHTTPIQLAVDEGLADKITGRDLTTEERAAWLQEEHDSCADEDTWAQEFCCRATDTNSSFLPYDLIAACEDPSAFMPDLSGIAGDLLVGFDVARVRDLSAVAALEQYGGMAWLRKMITMAKTPFHAQRETLWDLLQHPKMRRCCIEQNGIGMQLAEETQDEFGKYRVEKITSTNAVKEELAYALRRKFEDRSIRIPPDFKLRESLHSVKKFTTTAGNIRFDAARSDNGHADEFWALAFAIHAVSNDGGPVRGASVAGRPKSRLVRGYDAPKNGEFPMTPRTREKAPKDYAGY